MRSQAPVPGGPISDDECDPSTSGMSRVGWASRLPDSGSRGIQSHTAREPIAGDVRRVLRRMRSTAGEDAYPTRCMPGCFTRFGVTGELTTDDTDDADGFQKGAVHPGRSVSSMPIRVIRAIRGQKNRRPPFYRALNLSNSATTGGSFP